MLLALATVPLLLPIQGSAQSQSTVLAEPGGAPNIFGTVALPLKRTRYHDRWLRAVRAPGATGQLAALLRTARPLPRVEQLRLVNASLNRRIHYRHDPHPSGDHWSTAGETLRQSAGDCEDYAILKFHTLRSMGVPDRDLFMTIGHDGAANSIHAVLIVRSGGQYFILDNRTDELVPQESYRGFYPIMTFGSRSSWLHGYERGKTPPAVRAMSIALQSGRDVPVGGRHGAGPVKALGR